MKIGDYKQMMAYLTRPEQPKEQFASAETDALKKELNEKLGPGVIKTLDELPPVQNPFKDFEDRNPRETAADGGRANLAIGGGAIEGEDLGTREGFAKIRMGKVGTDREGLFGVRATNVSEADEIPGAVKFGKEQVYFNTKEEAENFLKNKEKYFKAPIGKNKLPSDDPARLKRIDDFRKDFVKQYGKEPTAKYLRTALNEQARVIDIYEAKYGALPKGTKISNVDTDVFKILKDKKVIEKLEAGKFPTITDITRNTKLDPVLSETRLLDLAEQLANTKYANVAKTYLENTSLVNPDSPFGGSKGKRARIILENRFTKGMGIDDKLSKIRSDILKEIYKIIPDLKSKGILSVDEISGLTSSMRGGFSPYPIFGQVTSSDFNVIKKGGTIDRTKGFLERALKELDPKDPLFNEKKLKLQKDYNDKISSFVKESNIGNPAKKVKAFKLSFEPPSKTVKNKKVYNQFKDLFDAHYEKYGYSFEVPEDTESLLDIRNKLQTNEAFRNTVKNNFNKLINQAGKVVGKTGEIINKTGKAGKIGTAALITSLAGTTFSLADEQVPQLPSDTYPSAPPSVLNKKEEETNLRLPPEAALAGVATAKYGPQLLKILKNLGSVGLRTMGSPLASSLYGASEILDYDPKTEYGIIDPRNYKVQEDPDVRMAGLSLLLPDIAQKVTGSAATGAKGFLSKLGRFALNPYFKGARLFTPVGLGIAGVGQAYDFYKQYQDLQKLKEEDPEAYEKFRRSRVDDEMTAQEISRIEEMGREGAMYGGRMSFGDGTEVPVVTVDDKIDELISFYQDYLKQGGKMNFMTFAKKYIPENFAVGGRVGFADGPEDPGKRKFMKIMGGLASLPIVGRFFDVAQVAEKAAPAVVETFKNAPAHFIGLVNKIRALGKIVDPKKLLRSEQDRFSNVYDYGDYRMFESPDGQVEIQKQKWMATDYGDGLVSEEYMSYDPKSPKFNKKGEKIPDEYDEVYEENTTYSDQYGEMKDVREGIEPETIDEGTYSKEELEQLIVEQIEDSIKKGKK